MNKRKRNLILAVTVSASLAAVLAGCGAKQDPVQPAASSSAQETSLSSAGDNSTATTEVVTTTARTSSGGAIDTTDLFTDRDLEQNADLTNAVSHTVSDGGVITITEAGVYVISGNASNAQIVVDAAVEDKVQLVLDGVSITNDSIPAIYVKNADKVFVTTASGSTNSLSVTGTFTADGDTNTDAVIFSKDDLVLNGLGTLSINSTDNAVSCKDDLKITGGSYEISCSGTAFEANDSIAIADGTVNITNCNDGLHAENDEDDSVGNIYICGGSLDINAVDDGIHATTIVQTDGGTININGAEGIEGTYIQINDGTINISASDDGINAAAKSTAYQVLAEFNGGSITIVMGAGDTDGVDSNGNITINGGTLDISGQSAFDYDGTAQKNGGTIIINGQETENITNQMMGGGMGGMRGGPEGMQGGEIPEGGMQGGPGGMQGGPRGQNQGF